MNKKAIVFGATSGIGRALAKLLVDDGYQVLITGRRYERLESICEEKLASYIMRCHDITNFEDSKILFDEWWRTVIINNSTESCALM